MDYPEFFKQATDYDPYPYQVRLATDATLPALLRAPTGAGKTEAVGLAWLWRLRESPQATPRRMVYCLPMRTLVEQTRERFERWLKNLVLKDSVCVAVLMGGEADDEWRLCPERPAVLIGTQDMLISRALNRGYGMSSFQWPTEFGLLNSDCLWVLDEVQLMANGLPTSTQMAAFRRDLKTYGLHHTIWMSATVEPDWLRTVDFPGPRPEEVFDLIRERVNSPELERRNTATKTLQKLKLAKEPKSKSEPYDTREVAELVAHHHHPGTRTLVVVNTVQRAQSIYDELKKRQVEADVRLVHSRFRPHEREGINKVILEERGENGQIIVATQAIEAGVDISARTLFTDLAPWASLVQRFGRCNRKAEYHEAHVYWLAPIRCCRHRRGQGEAGIVGGQVGSSGELGACGQTPATQSRPPAAGPYRSVRHHARSLRQLPGRVPLRSGHGRERRAGLLA